jgi:hypothetical protein
MERIGAVVVAPSTERKAEPGRFGAALRTAAAQLADGVAGTVALASPYPPGGAVLAGALHAAALTTRAAPAAGSASARSQSGSPGDLMDATWILQQQSQAFNLQYLHLQEVMQRESREFTALSNVMKVKHDSARAAIDNVR